MALIDNVNRTLQESLSNALQTSDSIDIAVGYFYMSGFEALATQLRDKKVRILVGMEIDPAYVAEIASLSNHQDVNLDRWQPRTETRSSTEKVSNYVEALVGLINDSSTFENSEVQSALDLFLEKIANGSLEIKKTRKDAHWKIYLAHNRSEFAHGGDFPGVLFMGSSNMTYSGLVGQGELNSSSKEKSQFEEHLNWFENQWSPENSISIVEPSNSLEFVQTIKNRVWKYQLPDPYELYGRVLIEHFSSIEDMDILTPSKITNGLYWDLQYQLDAIRMGIDRLAKFDGALIADVAGLGKSIIGSCIARNLDMRTVIVAPPHLVPQWEEYKEDFGIRGSKVFSSGKIGEVYERYKDSAEPILIILDEAHRYRNEDTNDYKMLHQIARSNPANKTLILTATPFNNAPKDVFSLIKLFQTPGQSTIRSIDNLSQRFRDLIDRYQKLRRDMTKGLKQSALDTEAELIALEQRRLIETVLIRRSRLDLQRITRYKDDLERQNVAFAEVVGPNLLEYDLGDFLEIYSETLSLIAGLDDETGFKGARYKPATYLSDRAEFLRLFGEELNELDLKTAQTNLATFMKRLLVTRFESSRFAFKTTLSRMIEKNLLIERWWNDLGKVPVHKKGIIPETSDLLAFGQEDGEETQDLEAIFANLQEQQGLLAIPKEILHESFISDVKRDTEILQSIYAKWFESDLANLPDPKVVNLLTQVSSLLKENPSRKIVIFSSYADTVDYLTEFFKSNATFRTLTYTASISNEQHRKTVKANFDASIKEELKEDDYDVLIATDALSEGFNLHRAGVIINFDIPYNPTRVIQRVGRINRIDKRSFEKIYIFNCFPTAIGEAEIRIRQISTLKIKLINAIVGSDHKTLTSEEEIQSFFVDEYEKYETEASDLSWDAPFLEDYFIFSNSKSLWERSLDIPRRSRIRRSASNFDGIVAYGKKGNQGIYAHSSTSGDSRLIGPEEALPMFRAIPGEVPTEIVQESNGLIQLTANKLFAKSAMPAIRGRRQEAIKLLTALSHQLPESQNYCHDLIQVIKEFDDINEGSLKDIINLELDDLKVTFQEVKKIVPEKLIINILNKVQRAQEDTEMLLLLEELN